MADGITNTRTDNAVRNITWGLINKAVTLVLPFVTRTVLIRTLGAQYLGLNSLFTSVLQVLSLAELGFGSAIAFSMYEPIAQNDTEKLCALTSLLRTIYRIVGVIILIAGLAVLPFLDRLVKGDVPADVNMYVLYLVYLLNTVLSYLLFAFKNTLFAAHQRSDINSKVAIVISAVDNILKILALVSARSYYLYVLVIPLTTVATNVATEVLSRKAFPNIVCKGRLTHNEMLPIYKRIAGLVSFKIYGVVFNAVDSVVISAYLGLVPLAVFNNYGYVQSAVVGVMSVFTSSITAGIGSKMVTHSREDNYRDYRKIVFLNGWLCSWCAICMISMYQPFMLTWVGADLMMPFHSMLLIVLYFFLPRVTTITFTYREAAGLWWEDRIRPLVATVVNVTLNIWLVQTVGMDGAMLSTIFCTIFINVPWGAWILHKYYFGCSVLPYLRRIAFYTAVTSVISAINWFACSGVPELGWGWLIMRAAICCFFPNILLWVCYRRLPEYIEGRDMAISIMDRKLRGRN